MAESGYHDHSPGRICEQGCPAWKIPPVDMTNVGGGPPVAAEAVHNHAPGTVCGETCPMRHEGSSPEAYGGSLEPQSMAMEGWKRRGRELNALYSAIGTAMRAVGIERSPNATADIARLAALAVERGELLEASLATAEHATNRAEEYGRAVLAIGGVLNTEGLGAEEARMRVRIIVAGLHA